MADVSSFLSSANNAINDPLDFVSDLAGGHSGLLNSVLSGVIDSIDFDNINNETDSAQGYIDPNQFMPTDIQGMTASDIEGFSNLTVKRLSGVGSQVIEYSKSTGKGGIKLPFADELSIFAGLARKAIRLFEAVTGYSILGGDIFGADGLRESAERYETAVMEAGAHITAVIDDFAVDQTEGNWVEHVHNIIQHQSRQHRIACNTSFVVDSPMINLASKQLSIQTRFCHNTADLYQGVHNYGYFSCEDTLTLQANFTERINYTALREVSKKSEYIAANNLVYGDNLWLQAGQFSKTPIDESISLASLVDKVLPVDPWYGTITVNAFNSVNIGTKTGVVAIGAGTGVYIDGYPLLINMGRGYAAAFIPLQNIDQIPKKRNVPTTEADNAEAPTQVGNMTPEPPHYIDKDFDADKMTLSGTIMLNAPPEYKR